MKKKRENPDKPNNPKVPEVPVEPGEKPKIKTIEPDIIPQEQPSPKTNPGPESPQIPPEFYW